MQRYLLPHAAFASLLAFAGFADASVIYSGVRNIVIPNTGPGLFVNVVNGNTDTRDPFPLTTTPGANYDINIYGSQLWGLYAGQFGGQTTPVLAGQGGYVSASAIGESQALSLSAGASIDGSRAYNISPYADDLANGRPVFFGFRFRSENDLSTIADDTVHYGWARVMLVDGVPGTLVDFAYESQPLTAIRAGAVPEPTSALALVSLAGIVRRRRR